MRHLRLLILLLVLASALLVALVRPLPGHALDSTPVKKQTRKHSTRHHHKRRHHHHVSKPKPKLGVRAAKYARRFIGVPYAWGGSSPRTGFDCSGFVRYVYQHFGVSLPHSSYAQFSLGRHIGRRSLRPGDLVFFDGLGHVGMYVGNGRFIHAPHTGTRVRVETLAGWYSSRFSGARRLRTT